MLKRLELVGFKSFADKTAFDFPAGISGIVGPNGSGKSNIVDAVRWVLGEQSAKSLRGGEMTDVIFNGSASRRSLGLAEVTMTFDNGRRTLATDADEVQITRRVYRGGEGEYLINHQPCRLKDIKDLFLGSGAGSDAYCIIEQGRVDVLLQASTKDRRTIFEEAAGISRFKAKKIETLRKLERVDQNLERLRDVLDEVEKQLRSVKLQAAKAQRYQEYAGRLKELRIGLGLQEYHQLSERLSADSAVLDELRARLAEQTARADAQERELKELEDALNRLDAAVREQEAVLASARQQIATEETTLTHEWSLVADLEADLSATRIGLAELNRRVTALAAAVTAAAEELRGSETQCVDRQEAVRIAEEELAATDAQVAALQAQVDADKAEHLDRMRQAARLQNDAVSFKANVDNLARERERLRQKSEQAAESLASLDVALEELTRADAALQDRLNTARGHLTELRQERDRLIQARDEAAQLAADLRARRSGLASRIEVLEGLERSHEGLGTGARELFALLERPDPGPWRTVRGIVADFLTVRRDFAPLIDLALGDRAHRFLVEDVDLLAQALRERDRPFSGRVSFLPLTGTAEPASPPGRIAEGAHLVLAKPSSSSAPSHPGVIALAEQVVRCDDPRMADLPARLLGRTLIVRDVDVARSLAAALAGCRFVTLQGELLEADGTLTVGTHHAETGILSRKSELRELREQVAGLDRAITETDHDLADLRERIALLAGRAENQQQEIDVLGEQTADLRSRMSQHRQRRDGLQEEVVVSRNEITGLEREIADLDLAWRQARDQAAEAEAQVLTLQARMESAERQVREQSETRKERQQTALQAKVALAQVEERLASMRVQHQQIEADLIQRGQERQGRQHHLAATQARLDESQRTLLQASAALASLYLQKETAERSLGDLAREANRLRQERQQRNEQAQADRAAWRTQQEQAHARELAVNNLRHGRDALCERLREDYQIELAEVYEETRRAGGVSPPCEPDSPSEEVPRGADAPRSPLDPAAANQEIAELRQKLSRLGSVNLDAIQEQNDLEARAGALRMQYDDLTAAQRSLHDIIAKINVDSRRLFTETFATIRTHFQELFRKLFGGGMADAVLEDDTDVLESGIEIVARPPGKELRSISLMSGGEKTLTAVALLLAIFRSKPSPFCILDEVDAALDEANIGRFTAVLRDFLDRSQFIIVTHSKRTMACADVLYGVTMQESGISKRFAVRFEDWPDDERKAGEPAA
jgi:chromosome segregation protein